jgi:hypothetical protein
MRRRRDLGVAGVPAMAVAVFVGPAVTNTVTGPPVARAADIAVRCVGTPTAAGATVEPWLTAGEDVSVRPGEGMSSRAVAACTRLWQDGELSVVVELQLSPPAALVPQSAPVRGLRVCTDGRGGLFVVPTRICGFLGLLPFEAVSG